MCPPRHVPPSSTHCLLCCMLDVLQKHACFLKYRKEKKKKKEDTLKPSSPCQTIALFTQVLLLIPSEFHTGIFVSYCCRRPTIDHNNSLFGTHKLVSFLKHNSNCSSENITGYWKKSKHTEVAKHLRGQWLTKAKGIFHDICVDSRKHRIPLSDKQKIFCISEI